MKNTITTFDDYISYIHNSTNIDDTKLEENMDVIKNQFEEYLLGDTIASYDTETNTITHTKK